MKPTGADRRPQAEELSLLSLAAERLSHSLRSPLNVCISLLDDHLAGCALSESDYRDGREALERICRLAADLGVFFPFKPAPVVEPLPLLLRRELEALRIPFEVAGVGAPRLLERQLISRSCRAISAFMERAAGGRRPLPAVKVAVAPHEGGEQARFLLEGGLSLPEIAEGRLRITDYIAGDRRLEALLLLAVDAAAAFHGGEAAVVGAEGSFTVEFTVVGYHEGVSEESSGEPSR